MYGIIHNRKVFKMTLAPRMIHRLNCKVVLRLVSSPFFSQTTLNTIKITYRLTTSSRLPQTSALPTPHRLAPHRYQRRYLNLDLTIFAMWLCCSCGRLNIGGCVCGHSQCGLCATLDAIAPLVAGCQASSENRWYADRILCSIARCVVALI